MVVLKKIKSATLVEAMIATVLVVIVFVIASLVLNNLLLNNFSKNTHDAECRLNELEYARQHGLIQQPYTETYHGWDIEIKKITDVKIPIILFTANKQGRNQVKKIVYEQ